MGPMPRLLSEITSNGEAAFPWKLHRVLEESERCGFSDIVSWQGNRAFKVHDPKNFEKSIMKKYFNQTRYKSFQRQLNIYGFERITIGADIGSYTHQLLVRGKPNICRFMVRTKVKNKGSKAAGGASRRASATGLSTFPQNIQPLAKMSRSVSCPGSSPSRIVKGGVGRNNEIFDQSKLPNSNRDLSIRTMPSTVLDDFSEDPFDPLDINLPSTTASNNASNPRGSFVSLDGMNDMNSNNMGSGIRNDLPSMLLCEDNAQDDVTALGNSSRSNTSHASDVAFQPTQLDPFQPKPIPEQHMNQDMNNPSAQILKMQMQQQRQQQQQQQQQQQHHRREQECRMLQLQIQQLQSQISNLNQQQPQHQRQFQQQQQRMMNNSNNYLCNGVAAIESSDRGAVTPAASPSSFQRNINHSLRQQLEREPEDLMLDPTPIYTPNMNNNNYTNNNNNYMNNNCNVSELSMVGRQVSLGSIPPHIPSGNVM